MPRLNLTDKTVKALQPVPRQVTFWDENLPNFGVRVSSTTKSWVVLLGQSRRRVTLGRYPLISLSDARTEAKKLLAEHTLGKVRTAAPSFSEAVTRYLAECETRLRPITVRDYRRVLHKHFKFREKLSDISQHDILHRIDRLKATPSEQNYAFTTMRGFLRWCVKKNYLDRSPLEGLSKPRKTKSRERVLTSQELAEVYRRADYYPFGTIIRLLILTGQRRMEIASLQWDWIHDDVVTIPDTKTHRTHSFPLSKTAQSLIENIPQSHALLFPAKMKDTPFNGWSKAKAKLDSELDDVDHFTIHDLRRTFASIQASLGTPLVVIEKILGHTSGSLGGIVGVYQRHSFLPEMRDAMTRYERYVMSLT